MCKTYGYARISTMKQNIDRQIRNIKAEYPSAIIVSETYTGTTTDRPAFDRLLKQIKRGDTIIFDSVSRMSRDAVEGYTLYERLFKAGIRLVFLKEHHIDTDTYTAAMRNQIHVDVSGADAATAQLMDGIMAAINTYILDLARQQIRIAFDQAEKEVQDLRQRTREGIETARIAGKQIGQQQGAQLNVKKAVAAKELIRQHSKSFGGTLDDAQCIKLAGISRNTYYKYKRELAEDA